MFVKELDSCFLETFFNTKNICYSFIFSIKPRIFNISIGYCSLNILSLLLPQFILFEMYEIVGILNYVYCLYQLQYISIVFLDINLIKHFY